MEEQVREKVEKNNGGGAVVQRVNPLTPFLQQRLSAEISTALSDKMEAAKLFIQSGFLPDAIKTPAQALIVMQTGNDLGLTWTESFRSINVIHNRPCMSAQLLIGLCYRTREVEQAHIKESTDKKAVYVLQRRGSPAFESVFTLEDAERAKFSMQWDKVQEKWKMKDNWVKQPGTMLLWRAMSRAARMIFPDAVCGIYTPDEFADELAITKDPETGEVTVVEAIVQKEPDPIEEEVGKPTDSPQAEAEAGEMDVQQLGAYVMTVGKYAGQKLSQIIMEVTGTGKAKGYEYLEWYAREANKNPKERDIVGSFLAALDREKEAASGRA